MLGRRASLNRFQRAEITHFILCAFFDHSAIKQGINNRKIIVESPSVWKLSNTLLNNSRARGNITMEGSKYFELNDNENKRIGTCEKPLRKCPSENFLF